MHCKALVSNIALAEGLHVLQTKVIGGNTVVRFNNQYCPELGVAMALGM